MFIYTAPLSPPSSLSPSFFTDTSWEKTLLLRRSFPLSWLIFPQVYLRLFGSLAPWLSLATFVRARERRDALLNFDTRRVRRPEKTKRNFGSRSVREEKRPSEGTNKTASERNVFAVSWLSVCAPAEREPRRLVRDRRPRFFSLSLSLLNFTHFIFMYVNFVSFSFIIHHTREFQTHQHPLISKSQVFETFLLSLWFGHLLTSTIYILMNLYTILIFKLVFNPFDAFTCFFFIK